MIKIYTKLNEGIYASQGGGETREFSSLKTSGRNLLLAYDVLLQRRSDLKEAYGNIGCGESWMEIDGKKLDRNDELQIRAIKTKENPLGEGRTPTEQGKEFIKENSPFFKNLFPLDTWDRHLPEVDIDELPRILDPIDELKMDEPRFIVEDPEDPNCYFLFFNKNGNSVEWVENRDIDRARAVEFVNGVFDKDNFEQYEAVRDREDDALYPTDKKDKLTEEYRQHLRDNWRDGIDCYFELDAVYAAKMLAKSASPAKIKTTIRNNSPQVIISPDYANAVIDFAKSREIRTQVHKDSLSSNYAK